MPIPTTPLTCASASFILRIADRARRGKAVDLTLGKPGFANAEWQRGAYITTLARNKGEGLSSVTLAAIGKHVSAWPTTHKSKADFDLWHAGEIFALGILVKKYDPTAFWSYGRAQKYINILLKYACAAFYCVHSNFTNYASDNPGLGATTQWLHAPVDSITLKHASRLAAGSSKWRNLAWSKALTAEHYYSVQKAIGTVSETHGISPIHYEMVYIW